MFQDPYDAEPWIQKCNQLEGELQRYKNMLLRVCHKCYETICLPNDIYNFWIANKDYYLRQVKEAEERELNKKSGLAKLTQAERKALGL